MRFVAAHVYYARLVLGITLWRFLYRIIIINASDGSIAFHAQPTTADRFLRHTAPVDSSLVDLSRSRSRANREIRIRATPPPRNARKYLGALFGFAFRRSFLRFFLYEQLFTSRKSRRERNASEVLLASSAAASGKNGCCALSRR